MAKTAAKPGKNAKQSKPSKAVSKAKPKAKPVSKPKANKAKPIQKKAKPAAKKPISKKPVAKKSAVKKVVAKKPIPKKPVVKKAATKKPVSKKVVTKKPVVKKAVVVKKPIPKKNITAKPIVKKVEIKNNKTSQVVAKSPVKKSSDKVVKKGEEVKKAVAGVNKEKPSKIEKTIEVEKAGKAAQTEKIGKIDKMEDKGDSIIEKRLRALISLQQIDSQIDKIRIIRGELPLEVQDLEDEIVGIQTRIENYTNEANALEEAIAERKNAAKQCQVLIKKYETQQSNVRNNREYDSLTKEIEFQNLEIQLCDKRVKEYKITLEAKKELIDKSEKLLKEKQHDAKIKKDELTDIVAETEKDESNLLEKSLGNQKIIEDRLLSAYKKIRKNARNGLAVVVVERDSCGGCFNKIPPQRQLDIRIHKKIIVCEYCGRILVDPEIVNA
jgi:predicted  nucleic acid-binding Zn-ribbon protein